jgi:hypothetical protein
MPKCHVSPSHFCKVLNPFDDHMPNTYVICRLRCWTAENFPKIWSCHGRSSRPLKPKVCQMRHTSHGLPNWIKRYSIIFAVSQDEGILEVVSYGEGLRIPNRSIWIIFLAVSQVQGPRGVFDLDHYIWDNIVSLNCQNNFKVARVQRVLRPAAYIVFSNTHSCKTISREKLQLITYTNWRHFLGNKIWYTKLMHIVYKNYLVDWKGK